MKLFTLIFLVLSSFSLLAQGVNKTDANGKKQGVWQKLYPNSRIFQYKGQFKDGKPVGKFTYYYEGGGVKAVIQHAENSPRSVAFYYHDNGKLMSAGIYMNEKKDSVWNNYAPSGRMSFKETYSNDVLNGLKTVYFLPEDINNTQRIICYTMTYKNGKADGAFKELYDFGTVKKEGAYKEDKKIGVWKTYHPNGKQMFVERYKDGLQHGWSFGYDGAGKEIGRKYFYYGKELTGKDLEMKLQQLKDLGISPNG